MGTAPPVSRRALSALMAIIMAIGCMAWPLTEAKPAFAADASRTAYAVLDSAGTLTFYAKDPGVAGEFTVDLDKDYEWHPDAEWISADVKKVVFAERITPISIASWFNGCRNLVSFDARNLDTSRLTNMEQAFKNCEKLESLDLSGFDTSRVADMSGMFYRCHSLKSLNLSGWNTSKVENISEMFFQCKKLESLDLSQLAFPNLKSMARAFSECDELRYLDISSISNMGMSFPTWSNYFGNPFTDSSKLETVVVGDAFEFYLRYNYSEIRDYRCLLPGTEWRAASDGLTYAPEDIPGNKADTYTRVWGIGDASIASIPNQAYTGKKIAPVLKVTMSGKTLTEGVDYSSTYANNLNAGTATVTIKGIGSYGGEKKTTFRIVPASPVLAANPSSVVATVGGGSVSVPIEYNGDGSVSVSSANTAIATVSYSAGKVVISSVSEGATTVTVKAAAGKNYAEGSIEIPVSVAKGAPKPITGATIAAIPAQTWTGKALTPALGVTLNGKKLAQGTDFTASYKNNTAAGTATVTITGKGAYTGSKSATFKIARAKVAVPSAKSGLVYNGKAQTGVAAATGYKVTGGSATDAGSYTATATPDLNHMWSDGTTTAKKVAWKIAKANPTLTVTPATLSLTAGAAASTVAISYKGDGVVSAKSSSAQVATVAYTSGKVTVRPVIAGKATVTVTASAGKNYNAKSASVAVTVSPKQSVWKVKRDTWSFSNFSQSTSAADYVDLYGYSQGMSLYQWWGDIGDGGCCYGMTSTAQAIKRYGYPALSSFASGSSKSVDLWGVGKGWRTSTLSMDAKRYIVLGQISQSDPIASEEKMGNAVTDHAKAVRLVEAARAAQAGGDPVYLSVRGDFGGHAIGVIGVTADDSSKTAISVYDCNHPGDDRYLYLYKSGGRYTSFKYDLGYGWVSQGALGSRLLRWANPADDLVLAPGQISHPEPK